MAEADKQRRQALFINLRPEDLCNDDVVNKVELNSDDEGAIWQNNSDGKELDNENIIDGL
jgi:hypothetical protein